MSEGKEIMNTIEAAKFLGVSKNTLYDAAGRLEVPFQRIGKRMLFSRTALIQWLSCNVAQKG